jgi:Flp pilus assembly protein TadG
MGKTVVRRLSQHLSLPKRVIANQGGVTAALIAVAMFALLGVAALAVDLGHLYVVRNELQNAADAGALAGARILYNDEGTSINVDANQRAYVTALANRSDKTAVEVNWTSGNTGDVQRGHWSFAARTFTPNDSTAPVELWNVSTEELDANVNFINAVRVIARRQATPAASFFARIFGHTGFELSATAVAYIGFAGTLLPFDAKQPIAICKQSILDESGDYTCGVGRMINSGSNAGHNTGGWTNFSQPCETASAPTVKPLVCGAGNPEPLQLGQGTGTTGGEVQTAFDALIDCWIKNADTDGDKIPDQPWEVTLPVVDCPTNNLGPCSTVKGAVTINIVWITRTDKNQMKEVPRKMGKWSCPAGYTGQQCWQGSEGFQGFVDYFQLKDVLNSSPATYEDKTIYFLPDCTPHEPAGTSGGENFGILAEIPVLVK